MIYIEKFMEWLDTEIKNIEIHTGNNNMLQAKYSEAIRIRQQLCNMDAEPNTELEDIAGKICDWACKYPQAYWTGRDDDNERMIKEKCSICPLSKILE